LKQAAARTALTRHRIEALREEGGIIFAPACDTEPDVPNAFFKAVKKFGAY